MFYWVTETFLDPSSASADLIHSFRFDDYKKCEGSLILLMTFALVKDLIDYTTAINLESSLKSPISLPEANMPMSKPDQFFEVADKIIGALDQEVVSFSDLVAIACGGKTEQSCSQCHKKIVLQGIYLSGLPIGQPPEIFLSPIETERYICEATKCSKEEYSRNNYNTASWFSAVLATANKLEKTRCDFCFLLPSLKDTHRSKCLTKNYCSQICRDADEAAHKVCCNPDKEQRRIEERKVKLGGRDRVEAANAQVDSLAEALSGVIIKDPALNRNIGEIIEKTKKAKPKAKMSKKKKANIDEVDK